MRSHLLFLHTCVNLSLSSLIFTFNLGSSFLMISSDIIRLVLGCCFSISCPRVDIEFAISCGEVCLMSFVPTS